MLLSRCWKTPLAAGRHLGVLLARWRLTGLWRHPEFMKLWLAQTISPFGSHITGTGLPLAALLTLGATPGQMGLLAAVSSAPWLLFGLPAGAWVDRLRRRPVLIAADLGRALLLLTIPLAAVLGRLSLEHLFLVAVAAGTLDLLFEVAHRSYLPTLIHRENLLEGNSKLEASGAVAEIGGPAVVGAPVQAITAPFAIAFDALSFLVSALLLGRIRTPEPPPARGEGGASLWAQIGDGLRLVRGHDLLRPLVVSAAIGQFFGMFIGSLYSLFAIRELGLTPVVVGVLIGVGGASALPGTMLAGPLTRRFGLGRTLVASLAIWVAATLLIPLAPPGPGGVDFLFASQLVGDIAAAVYFVNEVSLRQQVTPDHLLGRANATTHFVVVGAGPLGALAASALSSVVGVRPTLFVAAFGKLMALAWILLSPLPRLREAPDRPACWR